ncbi:MAG: response regulator [Hydrogenophilales bacterium]|nr:response regulator [Hydrogenophilales bacterium]
MTRYRDLLRQAFFNDNGLARRLIVALVLFSSVLTAVITAIQLHDTYRSDVRKINDSFRFIQESAAPTLVNSIWVVDNTQIKTQLEGLLRLRDIEFIGIYVDGQLRWSAGAQTSSRRLTDEMRLTHPYRGRHVPIGEVRVIASLDKVWTRLFDQLLVVLVENGIKTLLVAAFMLLVLQLLITRHLAKLSAYARSLRVQGLEGEDLKLDRPETGRWRPDALDHLTQAINAMRRNLRSAYREMNEANGRLRESEALLASIINNSSAVIYVKDAAGRYLLINRVFERLFNITDAEIKGRRDHDIFPKEEADAFRANDLEVIKQKMIIESEALVLHPDGPRTYLSIKFPLVDAEGKIYASAGISTDISARKQAEETLKQFNAQLEGRVGQRTADLTRAKDEAERANLAKSEFLSRMSHELRTPMNAILGFAQLLESDAQTPLSPDQHENVHEILHAGRHLLELINEVLDLARIESGRVELAPEPVSVTQLVKECMTLMQPLAAQRDIHLSSQTGNCAVRADRLRLRQILLNLLSNAIKYNHASGSVEIVCHSAPEGWGRVTVRDNGRGISADALPRLFIPFERVESSNDGIEGAGIGLALCKKLAESMGGAIGVESVAGEGSTFWVEFPLAAEVFAPAAATEAKAAQTVCAGARTLLYVEDNPANLRLVEKLLAARPGLSLLGAPTAEKGLDIARARQPDLILLDINLPGMDGFEALRHLRNDPATRNIPVIALTANAMPKDVEKGLAAGFSGYLTKPIDVPRFLAAIDRLLSYPASQEGRARTG